MKSTDKFTGYTDDEMGEIKIPRTAPALLRPRVVAAAMPAEKQAEPTEAELRAMYGFQDIEADMDEAPEGKTWIEPNLIEEGRPIWFGGRWKVGKSLFMLQKCVEMTLGTPSDLDVPEQDRILWADGDNRRRVLYLDRENLYIDDVLPRIRAMGYNIKGLSENLLYLSFPKCDPLNTEKGAKYIRHLANTFGPDLIVLDSVSTFITGAEKEPETWMRLHQELLIPLRIDGIATVMIDHPGHGNDDRNSGSAAKGRIADALWMLKAKNTIDLSLTMQWARMPVEHRALNVSRTTDPLRHTLSLVGAANGSQRATQAPEDDAASRALAAAFDAPVGINKGIEHLRSKGIRGQQNQLRQMVHTFNDTFESK